MFQKIPTHIHLRKGAGKLAKFMGTTNFIQPRVKVPISGYILQLLNYLPSKCGENTDIYESILLQSSQ